MRDKFNAKVFACAVDARFSSVAAKALTVPLLLSLSLCVGSAQAWISPGMPNPTGPNSTFYKENGELVFVVSDSAAKISYTLDLGLDMTAFLIAAQQETSTQMFFPIADPQWTDFLTQTAGGDYRWTVFGVVPNAGTAPGRNRLFTTVRQGQESLISTMDNSLLTQGNSISTSRVFIDAVNTTGTHGATGQVPNFPVNGSSVNAAAVNKNSFFGEGSYIFSDTLLGKAPFSMSNKVGDSSWFYYLTRSGVAQTEPILVDEFDNLGHDGYWGFTKVADDANSPYKGQYLLSYTLEASGLKASTAAGQMRMNLTDYTAGFAAKAFSSSQIEFGGYRPSSLVVAELALAPLAAVPEPTSWGLMGLGLLALAGRARRRAAQA